MFITRILSAIALSIVFVCTAVAVASPVKTPHVEAELIALHAAIEPGKPVEVALRLKMIEHWHTYWRNPGDSGLPTKLKWKLPAGFAAGDIQWPYPKNLPLGPLMNFGYEGEVLHLVTIQTPANLNAGERVTLSAKADWLVCNDVCIPEDAALSITLPVAKTTPVADPRWEKQFADTRAALPTKELSGVTITIKGNALVIAAKTDAAGGNSTIQFYPYRDDVIANAAKQTLTKTADGFSLRVAMADPINAELKTLDGVLVIGDKTGDKWRAPIEARAVTIAAPVVYGKIENTSTNGAIQPKMPQTAQPDLSLLAAIAFAFLGGLILNLMPCVFPVLGIKVMSFVDSAHGDQRVLRRQGIAFLVGVVLSFLVLVGLMLALRAAGQSIGWGFQLQEPLFVAALAVLFFLMALNLSGVFEIGTSLQTVAGEAEMNAQKNPLVGAFASGVLATVVATPCMAPGLGASVGFTLSQSVPVALLVFLAMAIGLALPVVLLSFFPVLLRLLPRPGAWMQTFKQFMAFPLYATVVWLVWVLGAQTGNDGVAKCLVGLTVIALATWIYGRWQAVKPLKAVIVGVVIGVVGVYAVWQAANTALPESNSAGTTGTAHVEGDWIPFSPTKIAALRAEGKSVFVDFTATWCITCQVNKRIALNQDEVIAAMKAKNVVRMKADWTRKDAAITEALASFGRNGVPLYVFYPSTGDAQILPEVLTPAVVIAAIQTANK